MPTETTSTNYRPSVGATTEGRARRVVSFTPRTPGFVRVEDLGYASIGRIFVDWAYVSISGVPMTGMAHALLARAQAEAMEAQFAAPRSPEEEEERAAWREIQAAAAEHIFRR